MARLRYNGLTATLGADLLTADTAITFTAALTSAAGAVPTISGSDYIPLAVLDTDGSVLEIIHLTAYTSGATTGTVTRSQESTTAADHATGLTVVNGLTVADTTEFTSGGSALASCKASRTTAQSIPASTATAVQFTSPDVWDTHSMHSTSTNPTRVTIPTGMGGVWLVSTSAVFAANATGYRLTAVQVNGADPSPQDGNSKANAASSGSQGLVTSCQLSLSSGDYLELLVVQSTSGALDVTSASLTATYLGTP